MSGGKSGYNSRRLEVCKKLHRENKLVLEGLRLRRRHKSNARIPVPLAITITDRLLRRTQ
jgi:hypothetical protein